MAPPLRIAHPQNATIEELKQVSRVGSNETATRCSAIQMLLAGAHRELVCNALLVTHRVLRNLNMTSALSKEAILMTPNDEVRIRSFCNPQEIEQYTFDSHFGISDDYKSLFTRRESLAKRAAREGVNVVLALAESKNIIGYGLLAYPDAGERWAELGAEIMMEIKAIEVFRPWRSAGIAPGIVKMMLAYRHIEEKIIYLVGYSWTWDLKGKKLTGQEYRQILIKLFEPFGFKEYETNEPNVCLRPENILMCRVGQNVTQEIKDRFKWLRFGLSPWTWKVNKH